VNWFGKIEVDAVVLSKLYQDSLDLVDKLKRSAARTDAQNKRDCVEHMKTFHSLIDRLGTLFKPEVLSEEERDKDVDMLGLVKDVLPELSVENVKAFLTILSKSSAGSTKVQHVKLNSVLRKFHAVRYHLA